MTVTEAHTKDDIIRGEIIQSARDLFQRYGFFKTTMEDIAKATGKGKSTLYYYHPSKDDIFNAMLQEDMAQIFECVKTSVAKATSAEEKIKIYVSTKLKLLIQKANLYNILRGEISDHPNLIKKFKKDFRKKELELFKDIIAFGISNKEFKKTDDDIENIAFIVASALRGIEISLWEEGKIKNAANRLDIILNLICYGIKK